VLEALKTVWEIGALRESSTASAANLVPRSGENLEVINRRVR
jgi:hypothetical protein